MALCVAWFLIVFSVVSVVGLLMIQVSINTSGVVSTIGIEIYKNGNLTQKLEAINWGNLTADSIGLCPAWIKNTGNQPATMTLSADQWQPPEAEQHLTIAWDWLPDMILQPNQTTQVTFYLIVSEEIEGIDNFSNVITVTATEKGENN